MQLPSFMTDGDPGLSRVPAAARAASHAADEACAIARMATGDATALRELYSVMATPIFSYALKSLGNREEAEEVLQDTFVRMWEKAATYDPSRSRPFTWAVLIARGLCWDRLRKSDRRPPSTSTTTSANGMRQERAVEPNIEAREELRRICDALQQLPQADRQAVEMAVFLQYTGQEIAQHTAEPLGTVKSRIRRGLLRLRHIILQS